VKLKRNYNLSAPKGVNGRNSDNTRIQQLMGWQPSTRLRDGLEKTYAWIHDQVVTGARDKSVPALAYA
jgi:nucleoside-diphosphate-sugar epimerase